MFRIKDYLFNKNDFKIIQPFYNVFLRTCGIYVELKNGETKQILFDDIVERDKELKRILEKLELKSKIDDDLREIVISAFRYALGRRTYITYLTCNYIVEHSELVNKRVKEVLLQDLEKLDRKYRKEDIDYHMFTDFRKWLESLEVEE